MKEKFLQDIERLKKEVWGLQNYSAEVLSSVENVQDELNEFSSEITELDATLNAESQKTEQNTQSLIELRNLLSQYDTKFEQLNSLSSQLSGYDNKMELYRYSPAAAVGSTIGQGYLEYKISKTTCIRYCYGLVNCTSAVTFAKPFKEVLWGISSISSMEDVKTHRSTIKTMTTTGLTFYAGAGVMTRFLVIGIADC